MDPSAGGEGRGTPGLERRTARDGKEVGVRVDIK